MKTFIIILLATFSSLSIFSQDMDDKDKYCHKIKFKPSASFERKMRNEINKTNGFINLISHPLLQFSKDSSFFNNIYEVKDDTIIINSEIKTNDSVLIVLKSGVSWLFSENKPPPPPSKKEKCSDVFRNRQKYNEFCVNWEQTEEFPFYMIDRFIKFSTIIINKSKEYDAVFEFTYTEEGKLKIKNKELKHIDAN